MVRPICEERPVSDVRDNIEDKEVSPRDLAARAAWMSFVGRLTQDEIAQELGISRQRAQRLVARASSEGLIRVRIEHPIAECLEMERALKARYGLTGAWIAPRMGGGDPVRGLATFAAPVVERMFLGDTPLVMAVGTGRTLRAVVEQMEQVDGTRHRIVALNGNIAADGSATSYEVIMRLAEKTGARHYLLGVPVVARTCEELELYKALPYVRASRELAKQADITLVGLGQMGDDAPLHVDGFISREELAELRAAGAAGEITGHVFDGEGRYLDHPYNSRLAGIRVPVEGRPVCGIVAGPGKLVALRAALRGKLLTQLVTDEATAKALL